jgi:hypothetical protein
MRAMARKKGWSDCLVIQLHITARNVAQRWKKYSSLSSHLLIFYQRVLLVESDEKPVRDRVPKYPGGEKGRRDEDNPGE